MGTLIGEGTLAQGDAALVRAAQCGDGRARTAIWQKYRAVVRLRMRHAIGERDVDDHVQEVFLALYENLSRLRDPAALRAFILGIARCVAGTELRRRNSRWWLTLTLTGDLPELHASGGADTEAREILRSLYAVVGKLGPEGGRVFQLRYVENRELKQVAKAMNTSLTTTKRRLARASIRFLAMAEQEPLLARFLTYRRGGCWHATKDQ